MNLGSVIHVCISTFSPALGQGWRLGFLGLLHMDVFNQRLEQEYNANVIMTAPNVPYKGKLNIQPHSHILHTC